MNRINKEKLNPEIQVSLIKVLNSGKHEALKESNETSEDTIARWIYEDCLKPLGW